MCPAGCAHPPRRQAGNAHDEGHLRLGGIEIEAVFGDAVLAEPFTMIASEDDRRAIPQPCRPQGSEQPREVKIREPNLAVVAIHARRSEGWNLRVLFVREVRIVVVEPQEELAIAVRLDEGDGVVGHLARRRPSRLRRSVHRNVQHRPVGPVEVHPALEPPAVAGGAK